MANAPNYLPTVSFANEESISASGRSTVRTVAVDTELANVSSTVNFINDNLKKIQRDDGLLRDFLIEPFMLSEPTRALLATNGTPRGDWTALTQYNVSDNVRNASVTYICHTAHTSTGIFDSSKFTSITGDGSAATSAANAGVSASTAATSAVAAAVSAASVATAAGNATSAANNANTSAIDSANNASSASISAASASASSASAAINAADAAISAANAAASTASVDTSAYQKQTFTAYTTTGSSAAYTITPTVPVTSFATPHRFRVKFHTTSNSGPTLNVGLGPANLKKYDIVGQKINARVKSNQLVDVEYDGNDYVCLNLLNDTDSDIISITATKASGALTATINTTVLPFRSTTLTSGVPVKREIGGNISIVVPLGATLGTVNGIEANLIVVALDVAGTIDTAIINPKYTVIDEKTLISTVAISASADNTDVFYSAIARTNVAFRVCGLIRITNPTAGTWDTDPILVQGSGGFALDPLIYDTRIGARVSPIGQTSVGFALPRGVSDINFMFENVSTSGNAIMHIQLSDAGGVEVTGYLANVGGITDATIVGALSPVYSAGFPLSPSHSSSFIYSGVVSFIKMDIDEARWVAKGINVGMNVSRIYNIGGYKQLSSEITSIHVATVNGTDVFTSGSFNVSYTVSK